MFADEASKKPLEIVYVTNITEKAPPSRKQQGMINFVMFGGYVVRFERSI